MPLQVWVTTSWSENIGRHPSQPLDSLVGGEVETVISKSCVGSRMPRISAVFSCQLWLLKPSTSGTLIGSSPAGRQNIRASSKVGGFCLPRSDRPSRRMSRSS
jgi:hypothetical protein